MKRIATAIVLSALLAPAAFAGPWIKSVSAAQARAKEKNQLIFVDLFADWCGWCHRMEQEVFPSEVFQNATDDMILLRLNTEDKGEGTKLAQSFQATTLPMFLVLTPEMYEAGRIRGYMPAPNFVQALKQVRSRYDDFKARVKNESNIAKDYDKRLALAREFTERRAFKDSETRLRKLTSESGVPANIRDQAYYELSVSLFMQNRQVDAMKNLDAFAKVQSQGEAFERSRILAAQIYMQQGNLTAAANEFRRFKTSFPKSPFVNTADMYLPIIEAQMKKQ